MYPTKPPTPADYAVIIVVIAVVLIAVGVVDLTLAFRLPPENHDRAMALEYRGFWSLGSGAAFAAIIWLRRRFMD